MKGIIQLYRQQFRTYVSTMFAYRASLAIWMISAVLEPLVYLIVWKAVSNARGGSIGDYSSRQFAAYYILSMIVIQITDTWIMYEWEYRIREGILSFALLKPVHPIHSDIAENISSKILTTPLIVIVALGLSLLFHPALSFKPWTLPLLLPAIALAFGVRFLLEWTLAQAAFWTTRVGAVNQTYYVIMLFLSGQFAPLSLFPPAVRFIANALPFRWLVSFPIDLIMGRLTLAQALAGLGAQAAWLIAGYVLLRFVWREAVKVYSAVGS